MGRLLSTMGVGTPSKYSAHNFGASGSIPTLMWQQPSPSLGHAGGSALMPSAAPLALSVLNRVNRCRTTCVTKTYFSEWTLLTRIRLKLLTKHCPYSTCLAGTVPSIGHGQQADLVAVLTRKKPTVISTWWPLCRTLRKLLWRTFFWT